MSVEQPSSDRPTGPPSGPLSGPTQPPVGPPSQPPADGGGGSGVGPGGGGEGGGAGASGGSGTGPGSGPGRPWWRSVPRIAVLAASVLAAVALIVVLTRSEGTSDRAGGEIFLQAADKSGPYPFTQSTAKDSSAPPAVTPTATVSETAAANVVRRVDGGAAGLYGGTRKVASCDVEKQIRVLGAAPAKNGAFASVLGLRPAGVPAYLRSLTPVQLRMDTRVTNHGYRDGAATSYQAVLQTGTAVLVDDRGRPRVRCACGNPLADPVRQQTTPHQRGDAWPAYRSSNVVVVAPSTTVINVFVVYDPDHRDWFHRHHGDTGRHDQKTAPPAVRPSPSVSSSTPSTASSEPSTASSEPSAESSEPTSEAPGLLSPRSPLPCVSSPAAAPRTPASPASPATPNTASPSATPCPTTSAAPSSSPPSSAPESLRSPPDDNLSGSTSQPALTSSSS
ncbi:hypothetical protein PV396_09710 [Streptomyces sp. ME02-8801-2C]|uniref:DUF6777 domain-containing protein n=1 Tax=Streptomyces sp. ME02-8801-2C TaxID=3028680 RepID=UPI0029B62F0F|nr:DUF6777 domain-containing protein [Streptomyces sp. ME02-8801-2C]MDX3452211.1 hypothetical protein [Streptomyces sp. ME02-8801-2C]